MIESLRLIKDGVRPKPVQVTVIETPHPADLLSIKNIPGITQEIKEQHWIPFEKYSKNKVGKWQQKDHFGNWFYINGILLPKITDDYVELNLINSRKGDASRSITGITSVIYEAYGVSKTIFMADLKITHQTALGDGNAAYAPQLKGIHTHDSHLLHRLRK